MNTWNKIARRIRVPVGFALVVLYFWLARPSWRSLAWGLMGIFPGLLIRALASGHVRKNEALATSGPYAYTRNPLYLGSLVTAIGFAVAARSWWVGAALAMIFIAIYVPVIRYEEIFLREKFPEFQEYARRVPRIWPRFRGPSGIEEDSPSRFSWPLYLRHREYNALIGAAAILAGLIVKMTAFRV
jgi:protein-S-isoprenylcysteine O-methyltransferase Ste14